MSNRKQIAAGILLLSCLLLTWAIFTALIQGAEVEQLRTENDSLRCELGETVGKLTRLITWMAEMGLPIEVEIEEPPAAEDEGDPPAPEETSSTSDFSAAGLIYPSGYGPETRDRWFPQGIQPEMEIYLGWRERYPEGYARLIAWGRGEVPPLPIDPAMQEASRIAYDGYRWDGWFIYRNATSSEYYGRGRDICYYLWQRGRSWENCLATLECESHFGLAGSIDFGILYGGYPNTVEGYCDLLGDYGVSDDPWQQACFWNMPGYPRYQQGFVKIVETMRGWRP